MLSHKKGCLFDQILNSYNLIMPIASNKYSAIEMCMLAALPNCCKVGNWRTLLPCNQVTVTITALIYQINHIGNISSGKTDQLMFGSQIRYMVEASNKNNVQTIYYPYLQNHKIKNQYGYNKTRLAEKQNSTVNVLNQSLKIRKRQEN